MTTVALPHTGPGRQPTAWPNLKTGLVELDNGGTVVDDQPGPKVGPNPIRTWKHPAVPPGAVLRDIYAMPIRAGDLSGQVPFGAIYVAGNGDRLTYAAQLR